MKRSTEIAVGELPIVRILTIVLLLGAALIPALASSGCDRAGDRTAGSSGGASLRDREGVAAANVLDASLPLSAGPTSPLRLASLSPAMTDAVLALGLGSSLVGRTPWCNPAVSEVPVIGSLNDFDAERLVQVRPTHLLVQPPRSGIDAGLVELAEELGSALVAQHIDGLDDVRTMLNALPEALLQREGARGRDVTISDGSPDESDDSSESDAPDGPGHAFDHALRARAAQTLAAIDSDIAEATDGTAAAAGRVLLLFSIEPVMAFGPGSYVGDLLVAIGGVNALDGRPYPELTLEDVQRLRPETILLVRARPGAAETDDAGAAEGSGVASLRDVLGRLEVPAVLDGRVGTLTHAAAMTPGPRVGALALALRDALRRTITITGTGTGTGTVPSAGASGVEMSRATGGPQSPGSLDAPDSSEPLESRESPGSPGSPEAPESPGASGAPRS